MARPKCTVTKPWTRPRLTHARQDKGYGPDEVQSLIFQVGVKLGANDHTQKKLLLSNHGGGQEQQRSIAPVKIWMK
jgi:hypothetical protein